MSARRTPSRCPKCDSVNVARIEYGYPGPEMMQFAGFQNAMQGHHFPGQDISKDMDRARWYRDQPGAGTAGRAACA